MAFNTGPKMLAGAFRGTFGFVIMQDTKSSLYKALVRPKMDYSMLPYFPDAPISGHFDFTILHFVVKRKQIRTYRSKDLSTSLLSFVLFAVELRFV